MPKAIGWRDIERALIETLRDHEIAISYERGNSFIRHRGVDYCLADLAKEVEKRLT